jgi:hypothetical protein
MELERPRVRNAAELGFESRVLAKGVALTHALDALITLGFLRGLSVRDVEALLEETLGEQVVGKSTVARICQDTRERYRPAPSMIWRRACSLATRGARSASDRPPRDTVSQSMPYCCDTTSQSVMEGMMQLTKQRALSKRRAPLTKRLTNLGAASERRGARLTKAGGWIAVAFGALHMVFASLESRSRDVWSQAVDEGWWNTFTLDEPTTLNEFERSETFWVTLGSLGVPVLLLGCYVVWSANRGLRVPEWIGWALLAWGLLIVTTLPASPGWAIPLIGGLIVLGDRRRSRAET